MPIAFADRVSLAANSQGDLLVSWIAADVHGQHRVVWASLRPAGGRFGTPQVLFRGGPNVGGPWATIGRDRVMVVAFAADYGMFARVRRGMQGTWQPTAHLGAAALGSENDVTPYVSWLGEVVVAWYHTQLCEAGCESPGFTEVAALPVGARRFRSTQLLVRDPVGTQGAPSGRSLAPVVFSHPWFPPMIAFLAAGAPAPGSAPTPTVVKLVQSVGSGYTAKGSSFTAPQALSPATEQASDVAAAVGPDGMIVTWIRDAPPMYANGTVFAAPTVSAPGYPFGPPEQVSPSEHVSSALVTFNPASRWPHNAVAPWIVAWTSRIQAEGPGNTAHTVVQIATPICPSLSAPPSADDPSCTGAQR